MKYIKKSKILDKNTLKVYNINRKWGPSMIKDNLLELLHEMEEVTKLFKLEPFDIYLISWKELEEQTKLVNSFLQLAYWY